MLFYFRAVLIRARNAFPCICLHLSCIGVFAVLTPSISSLKISGRSLALRRSYGQDASFGLPKYSSLCDILISIAAALCCIGDVIFAIVLLGISWRNFGIYLLLVYNLIDSLYFPYSNTTWLDYLPAYFGTSRVLHTAMSFASQHSLLQLLLSFPNLSANCPFPMFSYAPHFWHSCQFLSVHQILMRSPVLTKCMLLRYASNFNPLSQISTTWRICI